CASASWQSYYGSGYRFDDW
nr:immunoglobulin heavy chain junction region [Macaca mulatta]